MLRRVAFGLFASALVACAGERPSEGAAVVQEPGHPQAAAPDGHTSRDALDWAGSYEGFLPCASCPATFARLTLAGDGGFVLALQPLTRPADSRSTRTGQFQWRPDGNAIEVEGDGGVLRFAVGEGRLLLLADDGGAPAGRVPTGRLLQVPSTAPAANLDQVLVAHRWLLRSAADAGNQPIPALAPGPVAGVVLDWTAQRLRIDGGCNPLTGGYRIDGDDRLVVAQLAATMMACDAPLMAVDSALSGLLAEPVRIVLARGQSPVLALLTDAGDVLMFDGEPTLQALHGPPTTVFLEVAALRAACAGDEAGAGLCLQVREIQFDGQGLRVGEPSAFAPLADPIEGYEHVEGTRTVLRVERFATGDSHQARHVLDLVVESETTPR
jgi:hypothetical protein